MDCLFCAIARGEEPAERVLQTEQVVAFLDIRPVFKGHVLVAPRAHHETLPELPADLLVPLFGTVQRVGAAVVDALDAHGSFMAVNNTVSQSVPHLHVHVVPRRRKDGLRGFFWPRSRYEPGEAAVYAERLRAVLSP
jgi:histidine triad (HIT) family protein